MATIRERLTDFAVSQGFRTLSGFEKACGFTKNTLTKDREGISSTTLCKIVDFYPQLSLDWVILGRGDMLYGGAEVPTSSAPAVNIETIQTVNIGNWDGLKDVIREVINEKI